MSSQNYPDKKKLANNNVEKVSFKNNDQKEVEVQSEIERIGNLREKIEHLKSELKELNINLEQNVEKFKSRITNKNTFFLLVENQAEIIKALENCHKLTITFVKTIMNIGNEIERQIKDISLKINTFDSKIRSIKDRTNDDGITWLINREGKLTKIKDTVFDFNLPQFNCGNRCNRRKFLMTMENIFNDNQVPKNLWVKLASCQLIGMAHDWWDMNDQNLTWEQFTENFVEWTFSDNYIRGVILPLQKQTEFYKMSKKKESLEPDIEKPELIFSTSCNERGLLITFNDTLNNNEGQPSLQTTHSLSSINDISKSDVSENSLSIIEDTAQNSNCAHNDESDNGDCASNIDSNMSVTAKNQASCSNKRKITIDSSHVTNYKLRKKTN